MGLMLIIRDYQRDPGIRFRRCCNRTNCKDTIHRHLSVRIKLCGFLMSLFSWTPPDFPQARRKPGWCRFWRNGKKSPHCFWRSRWTTMNLCSLICTSVWTDHVSTMPQSRVVELVVIWLNDVFVANSHAQPVWSVFLNFVSNWARPIAFLLEGRLH